MFCMKMTPFSEYIMYDVFDESLNVTVRTMMGAHIFYSDGKVFALAEDDELWLKGSKETADWYLSRGSRKFSYIKKGKEQGLNFFFVPEEVIENKEKLNEWLDVALSVATIPKKK